MIQPIVCIPHLVPNGDPVSVIASIATDFIYLETFPGRLCQVTRVQPIERGQVEVSICPMSIGRIDVDPIAAIRHQLPQMTSEQRLAVFAQITDGYCRQCGGDKLPCFCDRDE